MNLIEDICNKITCPPKFKYSLYDLGSTFLKHGKRTDFTTLSHNNEKILCSYFQPSQIKFQRSCLIYLHSMNGSRLQSSIYVQSILKMGVAFCCFDFTGCGISEGQGISFGATEKHDVQVVISKVKQLFYINKFILWGRSMGAVCAVKYCQMISQKSNLKRYQIVGLILDSIFKSFSKLAIQIGSTQSQIPQFLIKAGYLIIKSSLQDKGNFKVEQLQLQKCINKLQIATIFLASQEDKTVNCQHSIDLYNLYKHSQKKLTFIKGLHNQSRDDQYLKQIKKFVSDTFTGQQKRQKNNSNPMMKYSVSKRDLLQQLITSQNNGELDDLQTISSDQVNCFCTILQPTKQQKLSNQRIERKTNIKIEQVFANKRQSFRKLEQY